MKRLRRPARRHADWNCTVSSWEQPDNSFPIILGCGSCMRLRGVNACEVKRLRALEEENAKLTAAVV